ncbi:sensor histidine kinase [Streptomyces montanisoli]|uniref:histidine kinase n=1 Tax=Streptomyces montanisoli TaxID=2798581 RepID=A0A940RXK5_9ACTN|nr:histidine kinase [Streptomyces montanisoli]MBP0457689.1 two-component sensor histidine kinase [Streptomyces montanisoli]
MRTVAIPRPHRDDVLIGAAGLCGGLLLWAVGAHTRSGPGAPAWALLPLVVTAMCEPLRRTAPRTALSVGVPALIGDAFTVGSIATVLMFTDLVYAAALYGPSSVGRRLPRVTALATVTVAIGSVAWLSSVNGMLLGVAAGLVLFAPAATGSLVRTHRDAADAAVLRAEQTSLLAEADRAQAVAAERIRMARELHDLIANHLSAIAIHSTAALSLNDAVTSREALAVIRENSVEGLAEMRRLIEILRSADGKDAEPAAAPSLDALDALLDHARRNGTGAELRFTLDDRRTARRAPSAPVGLAAYRIVQESLANALKYAAPGEVRVVLADTDAALSVRVDSVYGAERGARDRLPGSGQGLVGMAERAALLGGTFEAGPAAGRDRQSGRDGDTGLWRVRAVLPDHADGSARRRGRARQAGADRRDGSARR